MVDETSRPRPRSGNGNGNGKQPADEPGESSYTAECGRFACPVARRFPSTQSISKTCDRGSPDIRHVKEHLKRHHQCDCPRATLTACKNPLHITLTQVHKLHSMSRRRKHETLGEQWIRLFQELFPGITNSPAPCLPTSDHLGATARALPAGFAKAFGSRLREAGLLGADGRSDVECAELFARQYPVYVDAVSSWGLAPPRRDGTGGESSVIETQPSGEGSTSAELIATPDALDEIVVETEPDIRLEDHQTVDDWIDGHEWSY